MDPRLKILMSSGSKKRNQIHFFLFKNPGKRIPSRFPNRVPMLSDTLRDGSFTGDPERYVKHGSEMGVCFHRGSAFGEHGGALPSYEVFETDACLRQYTQTKTPNSMIKHFNTIFY